MTKAAIAIWLNKTYPKNSQKLEKKIHSPSEFFFDKFTALVSLEISGILPYTSSHHTNTKTYSPTPHRVIAHGTVTHFERLIKAINRAVNLSFKMAGKKISSFTLQFHIGSNKHDVLDILTSPASSASCRLLVIS